MITFGHTSEKRTRRQPWLLDIEDCTNSPSEEVAIKGLEESKRGRKMKKLHFRRFFRQTTTTRGGNPAGPPPEHHHRGGDSPAPTTCMCDTGHTPTQLPTCPLHPTKPYITPFPISFDYSPITHSPLPTHPTRRP